MVHVKAEIVRLVSLPSLEITSSSHVLPRNFLARAIYLRISFLHESIEPSEGRKGKERKSGLEKGATGISIRGMVNEFSLYFHLLAAGLK